RLPHAGGLRIAEHDAWDGVVTGGCGPAQDVGRRHTTLVLADVGERPDPGHVPDRPKAVAGGHARVHLDAARVRLYAHGLEAGAISTPTGPPPRTISRRGTSFRPVASRFVHTPSSSASPGMGGKRGSEPVETTM